MARSESALFRETDSGLEKLYSARRLDTKGATVQAHCIIAHNDEDAVYLAETMGGTMRVELWHESRLVKIIDP